jgi:hypothetical protein
MSRSRHLLCASVSLLLAACTNIGPGTLARDRFDYSSAITDSWKRQTLLNIVKLRYCDPPIFVDVGQIIAGYTLETGVSGSASTSGGPPGAAIGGFGGVLGGAVRFTDRPTITYVPMTGNKFVRGLMTPLPPEAVFQTIPSGWPADAVLLAAVSTINGLDNLKWDLRGTTPPEQSFLRALQLLREVQQAGGIGLRVQRSTTGAPSTVLVVRRNLTPELAAKSKELRTLLGLDQSAESFTLAFGGTSQGPGEIAVTTRSVLHIMMAMAMGVDVPEADIRDGRASPGLAADETLGRLIRIHCSPEASAEASVSVQYRNQWYWLDDRDLASKRTFSFMMMLFTLADPGAAENSPVITIPT